MVKKISHEFLRMTYFLFFLAKYTLYLINIPSQISILYKITYQKLIENTPQFVFLL